MPSRHLSQVLCPAVSPLLCRLSSPAADPPHSQVLNPVGNPQVSRRSNLPLIHPCNPLVVPVRSRLVILRCSLRLVQVFNRLAGHLDNLRPVLVLSRPVNPLEDQVCSLRVVPVHNQVLYPRHSPQTDLLVSQRVLPRRSLPVNRVRSPR